MLSRLISCRVIHRHDLDKVLALGNRIGAGSIALYGDAFVAPKIVSAVNTGGTIESQLWNVLARIESCGGKLRAPHGVRSLADCQRASCRVAALVPGGALPRCRAALVSSILVPPLAAFPARRHSRRGQYGVVSVGNKRRRWRSPCPSGVGLSPGAVCGGAATAAVQRLVDQAPAVDDKPVAAA